MLIMPSFSNKIRVFFIKVNSIEDIARLGCSFNNSIKTLYAIDLKNKKRLFLFGEKIKGVRNIYYYDTDTIDNFGIYFIENNREKFKFVNALKDSDNNYKIYKFLIIEVENAFKEAKIKKTIKLIRIKDYKAMIKRLIIKSIENEIIQKVYLFDYNKHKIIGAFNLFNNEELFAYSVIEDEKNENNCFFKYNFSEDSLKTIKYIDNTSIDIYIKIINLSQAFDFFKPG